AVPPAPRSSVSSRSPRAPRGGHGQPRRPTPPRATGRRHPTGPDRAPPSPTFTGHGQGTPPPTARIPKRVRGPEAEPRTRPLPEPCSAIRYLVGAGRLDVVRRR